MIEVMKSFKPTKEDLRDAFNRTTEDLIDYDFKVLFCGINPGIWSGATGFHFAKPGNRFWKVLASQRDLPIEFCIRPKNTSFWKTVTASRCFCKRTTARADELNDRRICRRRKGFWLKKSKNTNRKISPFWESELFVRRFTQPKAQLGLQD